MSGFLPESSMLQLINWSIRLSVLPSFLFQEQRQLFSSADVAVSNFITVSSRGIWHWAHSMITGGIRSLTGFENWMGWSSIFPLTSRGKQVLNIYIWIESKFCCYSISMGQGERRQKLSLFVALGTKRWLLFFFPTVKPQHFHIPETAVVIIWTVSKVHHVEQIHLDFLFSLPAS